MPYTKLGIQEAAEYLHISADELLFLARKGEIPSIREAQKFSFRKSELNDWASRTLFAQNKLKSHKGQDLQNQIWSRQHGYEKSLCDFIYPGSVVFNLQAGTKPSLIKELVNVATETGLVRLPDKLHDLIKEREDVESTAMTDGIALPHPRVHFPELFFETFIVIAKLFRPVHFGSQDGKATDLIFFPCAETQADHVFLLSRIASLVKKTHLVRDLRAADSEDAMKEVISAQESKLLTLKK